MGRDCHCFGADPGGEEDETSEIAESGAAGEGKEAQSSALGVEAGGCKHRFKERGWTEGGLWEPSVGARVFLDSGTEIQTEIKWKQQRVFLFFFLWGWIWMCREQSSTVSYMSSVRLLFFHMRGFGSFLQWARCRAPCHVSL